VISGVLPGGPGDEAGLVPGDMVLAIAGEPPADAEAALSAFRDATPGAVLRVDIRRDRRPRAIDVTPAPAYDVSAIARTARPALGDEARLLFSPSVLTAAGISPNAVVLAVDGRTPSSRALITQRLARARTPLPVLVRQGDAQFFVVVGPAR
jgi:hypothetical protein